MGSVCTQYTAQEQSQGGFHATDLSRAREAGDGGEKCGVLEEYLESQDTTENTEWEQYVEELWSAGAEL